jgi:hypothetical protein
MCGKELLGAVLNPTHLRVPRADGIGYLPAKAARRVVAEDLMRRFDELDYKPKDLVEVRDFFATRAPK